MTRPSNSRSFLIPVALVLALAAARPAAAALVVTVVASPTNVTIGQPVAFSASVTGGNGPFTYTWNFGDGGSASGALTVHAFASAGPFGVKCTVRDSSTPQQTTTGSVTVRVSNPPDPIDFQVKDTASGALLSYSDATGWRATVGENLTFVAIPYIANATWNFGDGSSSFDPQPVHAYEKAGTYVATLFGNGQSKSLAVTVETQSGPPLTGAFTYRYADGGTVDRNAVAAGRPVRFSATDSADTYLWSFGDAGAANAKEVDHAFGVPGVYTTTLAVTRAGSPAATTSVSFVVVGAGSVTDSWVLPGMAYTDGLNGALWQTDVTFFNPSPTQPLTLSVAFADASQPLANPSDLVYYPIVVDRQRSLRFLNILTGYPFYASKGSFGALFVRAEGAAEAPVMTARTYNSGSGNGTFGLSVPALPLGAAITTSSPLAARTLIGLKENATAYTNLGLVNTGGDAAIADVSFLDAQGRALGRSVRFSLGPYGVAQAGRILSQAGGVADPTDTFAAVVTLVSGTSVVPYASVIDVRSSDPIVVTASAGLASTYRLPGIVRTRGQANTLFRSDFYLHNPTSQIRKLNVSYSYRTGDGPRFVASNVVLLQARQTLELVDFVQQWLKLPASDNGSYADAFVDVTPAAGDPEGEPVLVLGKTYNAQPSGSTGLQIPGYTAADAASPRLLGRLVMTGLQSTSAYRTNLAFFLATPGSAGTVGATVRIYDGTGALVKSVPVTLDDFTSFVQKGDAELFGDLTGDRTRLTAVVEATSGNALIAAYATVIDGSSGDAIFVPGQPQASQVAPARPER